MVGGVDAQLTGGGTEWLVEVRIAQPLVAAQAAELPEGSPLPLLAQPRSLSRGQNLSLS